jgi:hypothetical protein
MDHDLGEELDDPQQAKSRPDAHEPPLDGLRKEDPFPEQLSRQRNGFSLLVRFYLSDNPVREALRDIRFHRVSDKGIQGLELSRGYGTDAA